MGLFNSKCFCPPPDFTFLSEDFIIPVEAVIASSRFTPNILEPVSTTFFLNTLYIININKGKQQKIPNPPNIYGRNCSNNSSIFASISSNGPNTSPNPPITRCHPAA